jgi:hypothetical protein
VFLNGPGQAAEAASSILRHASGNTIMKLSRSLHDL